MAKAKTIEVEGNIYENEMRDMLSTAVGIAFKNLHFMDEEACVKVPKFEFEKVLEALNNTWQYFVKLYNIQEKDEIIFESWKRLEYEVIQAECLKRKIVFIGESDMNFMIALKIKNA
jgi:hypothetical protein